MNVNLEAVETRTGHTFKNPGLLRCALTHRSASPQGPDNERLEFLGDAVLGLIVADHLYREHPELPEGSLDHMRASLINGRVLASMARQAGIDEALSVSESHRNQHSEPSDSMLEDAFEALIGALYLDGGLEVARNFIVGEFSDRFNQANPADRGMNAKGRLQEWCQDRPHKTLPEYHTVEASGPDHARRFTVEVFLGNKLFGRGAGSSKKAAETAAAEEALARLSDGK
ncbi:MAG: ribonuclease III [Opitutales bacterium]